MPSYRSRLMKDALMGVKPILSSFAIGDVRRQRRGKEIISAMETVLKGVVFEEVESEKVKGRWATPNEITSDSVILFSHGGGYIFNSPETYSSFLSRIALRCGMKVFAYSYRLAPEHPFPAALDDAVLAYNFLIEEGYDPSKIVLMGDSAGGGLCASLTHYLIENDMQTPRSLVLISPWMDLTLTSKAFPANEAIDPVLSVAGLENAAQKYCGDQDRTNVYISPLFGDFTGFPPTLIHVGSEELLLEDSIELDIKLKKDGAQSLMRIFNGMWHVFHTYDVPEAYRAINIIADFLFNLCNNIGLPPRTITSGNVYRHFKGRDYEVVTLARNSQNLDTVVVYKELSGNGVVWTRPIDRFLDRVLREGEYKYRFTEITNNDK